MKELPKIYEPQQVESRIYRMWEDSGCFRATVDPGKKPFSMPEGKCTIFLPAITLAST